LCKYILFLIDMGNFFLFLIFYKYLIDEVLHINTRFSSHKTSFNAVSKINFQYYKCCNSWKVISRAIFLFTEDLSRFTLWKGIKLWIDIKKMRFFSYWERYLLRLELWRNVTQRNGEHRGFIWQKSLGIEAPLVRGAAEDICEFY